MSPRLRCETSHAAPKVRNVNDPAAKANPMTYQIPVKSILAPSARASGVDAPRARGLCWCSRHSRPTVWRRPSPEAILPCGPEAAEWRAGRQSTTEPEHREGPGRTGVEHPNEGGFRVEVRLQGRGRIC